MKKVKIIFVTHEANLYGAPRSLLLLLENMVLKKYKVGVISPDNGIFIEKVNNMGIKTFIIPRNFGFIDHIPIRLLRTLCYVASKLSVILKHYLLFRKIKPSLVYANTIAYASPVIAAKLAKCPVIVHVRESKDFLKSSSLLAKIRLRLLLSLPDKFICVSKAIEKLLHEGGVTKKKTKVVYNGVNIYQFKPDEKRRIKLRKKLGLTDRDVFIGFIGQLIPRKGIKEFVEMANLVSKQNGNCRFIVVGGPLGSPYVKNEIFPLCEKYNIGARITFVGFKDDVRGYLDAIDLLVNASYYEPFARVNLEAMAMEKPVIATNVDGNPEAVLDGVTGFIVPPGRADMLAEKVLYLVENESLRKIMGKNGRKRVEENFTDEIYSQQVENIIQQLLR